MPFLKTALDNLPQIASSPLAFAGYILVVIAWFLIAWRVKRHQQLLKHLEKLPVNDRLEALRMEMGSVRVRSGLSPTQWIQSRIHLYVFLGFLMVAFLVLVLTVLAAATRQASGSAKADVTLYEPAQPASGGEAVPAHESEPITTVSVDTTFDRSGIRHWLYSQPGVGWAGAHLKPVTLTYGYERKGATVIVRPHMPFLEAYARGGPVRNAEDPVWQFPLFSLKVVNNTQATLFLSELAVQVETSQVDTAPIFRPVDEAAGILLFRNDGWGPAVNPMVRFALGPEKACIDEIDWATAKLPYEARVRTRLSSSETHGPPATSDTMLLIPVDEIVGEQFHRMVGRLTHLSHDNCAYCKYGVLTYDTVSGETRHLKFQSMGDWCGLGGGEGVEFFYELWLPAGKAGYTKFLPLSQSLKPGESDHFVVRIGTDRSAHFDLRLLLRDTGGATIPDQNIDLEIFVPHSYRIDGKLVRKGRVWKTAGTK